METLNIKTLVILAVTIAFGVTIGGSAVYFSRPPPDVTKNAAVAARALLAQAAETAADLASKKATRKDGSDISKKDAAEAAAVLSKAAAVAANLVAQTARADADAARLTAETTETFARSAAAAAEQAWKAAHP